MKKIVLSFLIVFTLAAMTVAAKEATRPARLQKTMVSNDVYANINRMNGIMRNNGTWFYDNVLHDWGLEWPKGAGLSPIFAAGQMVGARVNGVPRVAGVIHDATEFMPGTILSAGIDPPVAANRLDEKFRWYELRSDGSGDWNDWPVDQGAPVDQDGKPLLIGDQTLFCVYNDLAEHTLFSTPKLGVEVRQLVWAFDRADAIGDMVFIKWQLVNKSANDWDETYFVIWSDPDLGQGRDDFVGCDTTLGLGFCYNATNNDQDYGVAPPAVGIDFFQGPIVDAPGESVQLPDGTVLADKRMIKMTSFIYYNNDDSPQGNPQTGGDIWNYMRGYWRDGTAITNGGTGTDPASSKTAFMFSGDPETAAGWLDSQESDRRFMMTTGPYRMEKWQDRNGNGQPDFGEPGVQEIVAGVLVGRGSNNLNSVSYLKAIDEIAQLAYDLNFALPRPPKSPRVEVSNQANEVVLTWDERSELNEDGVTPYSVTDIVADGLIGQMMVVDGEYVEVSDGTYDFTGYTVFQYSDAGGADPVVYARLGMEDISDASPYTGARYFRLTVNMHPRVGNVGEPLVNGKVYFFGVQANSYCRFAIPQHFDSSPTVVTVVPQGHPGVQYGAAAQDTLAVTHSGGSDGVVVPIVIDKSKLTGKHYKVVFNGDNTWNLLRSTEAQFAAADTLLKNQTNQRGDEAYTVVDGLLVKVSGPPNEFANFSVVANGAGALNPAEGAAANWESPVALFPSLRPTENQQVGDAEWLIHTGEMGASNNSSYTYFKNRVTQNGARWPLIIPNDFEIRFTARDNKAFIPNAYSTGADGGVLIEVGFELWNIRDPQNADDDVRLFPFILDVDENGAFNLLRQPLLDQLGYGDNADHSVSGGANDPYTDWIYWIIPEDNAPGEAGYNALLAKIAANPDGYEYLDGTQGDLLRRMVLVNWNGGDVVGGVYNQEMPETGTVFRITTTKPNTAQDVFVFNAPANQATEATRKNDLALINVVPNPYYGYHSGEMNIFERWVQFTYLPDRCTIRIFDLAGNLIRKLEKESSATTLLRWDLKNSYGLPVASGIYVYHVEAPELGTKIGKLAVFTPNERLDTY